MLLSSKKRTNHISFMVVPHYDAKVRTIKIPYVLIYGLVIVLVMSGVMLWQLVSKYDAMSHEIAISEETNNSRTIALLEESFYRMSNELEGEQKKVSAISECMTEIERLDEEIMTAAGFDIKANDWEASLVANGRAPEQTLKPASISPEVTDNINRVANSIVSERDQRERSLAILKANYEEAHDRMDATPTGLPCKGRIQDGFGYYTWRGRKHYGVDIIAPTGSPIYAPADGKVIRTSPGTYGAYGNMIDVMHDGGIITRYGHLSAFYCEEGDYICKGQLIGAVGNTGRSAGSHLHYEIRVGASISENGFIHQGEAVDPLNFP